MKNHLKQNSIDFKVNHNANNDATPSKQQIISKTYRKKTSSTDSHPLLFLYNTPSTLNRYSNKKSLAKKSEVHSLEKKSQGKPSNERSIQRLKSIYKPVYQSNTLGIKSKLLKISHILMIKGDEEVKSTMNRLYEANREYDDLLKQWKRLQVFDETDEIIKKLVQNYTSIIQSIVHTVYSSTLHSIEAYQKQVQTLKQENQKFQSILQYQTHKFNVQMLQLQNRIYQQFQKNQWATFILNQISLQPFDVDLFVRNSRIYTKAKHEYMANNYFIQPKEVKNPVKLSDEGSNEQSDNSFIIKSLIQKMPAIIKK